MRVIDRPTPDVLVLGGALGGLYVLPAEAWSLYAGEYELPGISCEVVPRRWHSVRRMEVAPLSFPLAGPPPPTSEVFAVDRFYDVPLHTYRIQGVRCVYGYDDHTKTFFVEDAA